MDIFRIAGALRDIAEALEAGASAMSGPSPSEKKPASKKPLPPGDDDASNSAEGGLEPEVTLKDLQDLAADLLRGKRKAELLEVLRKFKLQNLSSAKPEQFPELKAALEELQNG